MDHSLTRSQRLAIKIHVLYCKACRRFKHDAHMMRETIKMGCGQCNEFPKAKETSLSPEAADAIAASLKARMSDDQ